jgi:small subunit ribosomal protein S16
MLKVRLTRMGDKKSPFYRINVADSRSPRDGRFVDQIGIYNPIANPAEIKIDADKAKDWIAKGAQPTETVRDLLANAGIIEKKAKPAKTNAIKKKKD